MSWGSLSNGLWGPYALSTSYDGISLHYTQKALQNNEEVLVRSHIHVLCNDSVAVGRINSVERSEDGLSLDIFMDSIFGCGYQSSLPYSCLNTTIPLPPACTLPSQLESSCQSGRLQVELIAKKSIEYQFALESKYLYLNDYYQKEADGEDPYGGAYLIQMVSIVEAENVDGTMRTIGSRILLSSLDWNITEPSVEVHEESGCVQDTHFTVTNLNGTRWSRLSLTHHLPMTYNSSSLLIDFELEGYQWASPSSSFLLITLTYTSKVEEGSQYVSFSTSSHSAANHYSYFQIAPLATSGNATLVTNLSLQSEGDMRVTVQRFNDSMRLEATLGIGSLPPPPAPEAQCSNWLCRMNSFDVQFLAAADIAPTWQYALGTLDPLNNPGYVVVLNSMSEVQHQLQGDAQVISGSTVYFVNEERLISQPVSRIEPDGSSAVSYNVTIGASSRWKSIRIQTVVSMSAGITHFAIEFFIEQYQWVSDQPLTNLQLEIDIGGEGNIFYDYQIVTVGDAYFQTETEGLAYSPSQGVQVVPVSLSYTQSIFAFVSHWEGSFNSSFTIGISSSSDPLTFPTDMIEVEETAVAEIPAGHDSYWIWYTLFAIGLLLTAIAIGAMVLLALQQKPKQQYTSLN
jgi:hypothetical protein